MKTAAEEWLTTVQDDLETVAEMQSLLDGGPRQSRQHRR